MNEESKLLSMISTSMISNDFFVEALDNEFQLEIAKHIYEDFGYHPNIVQDLVTGLKHKLDTEFCRKSSGLTHMDIHNPKI